MRWGRYSLTVDNTTTEGGGKDMEFSTLDSMEYTDDSMAGGDEAYDRDQCTGKRRTRWAPHEPHKPPCKHASFIFVCTTQYTTALR
jgi:hypothetical protein